jgi:hypothetical protein
MRTKMILWVLGLLALHIDSYAVVAYTPQALRECINAMYQMTEKSSRKKAFEELHAMVRENRMLTSDTVACQGASEAIEIMRSLNVDCGEVVAYLEHYLSNLHNRGILLALDGDGSYKKSWSMGLISRSMRDQQDAYNLLCLSNELSDNLLFCGGEVNEVSLDSSMVKNIKRALGDPAVNFTPNSMTNSQSLIPTALFGSTGVGSPVINGWLLSPDGPQFPVTMQFVIPDDFARHEPISLELGFFVPHNGFDDGYIKFIVQSKYVEPGHSFSPDIVNWTHTNTSGNLKIEEPYHTDSVRYMYVNIPLTRSHIKPEYFAMISVSRTSPTDGKSEYAGDVALVSAVFKYTPSK